VGCQGYNADQGVHACEMVTNVTVCPQGMADDGGSNLVVDEVLPRLASQHAVARMFAGLAVAFWARESPAAADVEPRVVARLLELLSGATAAAPTPGACRH
jgi:hypothetical protein